MMLALLITLNLAVSDKPWAEKRHSDWTLEETNSVLWDSPWVQRKEFVVAVHPRYSRRVSCFARIRSARPIRLALARMSQLQPAPNLRYAGTIDDQKVEEMAASMAGDDEIAVSLYCSHPTLRRALSEQNPAQFYATTQLLIGGDQETIPLASYLSPQQTNSDEALFRFVKPPKLVPEDRQIRFVFRLGSKPEVKLDLKFKLEDLMFEGEFHL